MIEEKGNDKKLITTICAIVAGVVVAVVVALVLLLNNNRLSDDFFTTSEGSKYVFSMNQDRVLGLVIDDYPPEKVHLVYFCKDDKVVDTKIYYVQKNDEEAKKAADIIRELEDPNIKEVDVNGKYVVVTTNRTLYDNMTAEDAKKQIEAMELIYNTDYNEIEDEVVEEEAPAEEEVDVENDAEVDGEAEDSTEEESTVNE